MNNQARLLIWVQSTLGKSLFLEYSKPSLKTQTEQFDPEEQHAG
jgi:hypothetical protein